MRTIQVMQALAVKSDRCFVLEQRGRFTWVAHTPVGH